MPRAVRYDEYGDVDVLRIENVPEPSPGAGELVVAVVASSINPGEAAIRSGAMAQQFPSTFPSGQGSDFAGRIRAVGEGILAWDVGDEVLGWTDERSAQADFVVVPDAQLTMKPPAMSWEQAGSLFVAGTTAYAAATAIGARDGETVAVSAAAGGVGSVLVQLLVGRGVRVLGIAGEGNAEWLRSVGVEPITHGDGLGHRLRAAAPAGLDAFVDLFGGGYVELAIGLGVAPERINTVIDFEAAERFGVKANGSAYAASSAVLAELAELIADGEITIPIAATFALDEVKAAYSRLADRHTRGKIVLLT